MSINDRVWELREWLALRFVRVAYRLDPEVGVDIAKADQCLALCAELATGKVNLKDAQERAYAVCY